MVGGGGAPRTAASFYSANMCTIIPLSHQKLRQVLFDVRAGNSDLAKSLSEKINLAMYQDENPHRGLPSLQNYQNWQFFLNFSDLNTRNWFFLIIQISMGFPYITDVVFSVLPTCYQTSSFFIHWGHSRYKVPLIIGQFASVACCVYNFHSGTWHRTWITEFWPSPPLEQQLKLVLNYL